MKTSYANKLRLNILHTLNVELAIKTYGLPPGPQAFHDITGEPVPKDTIVLAGLHKARMLQPQYFSAEELAASIKWLTEYQFKIPNALPPVRTWS